MPARIVRPPFRWSPAVGLALTLTAAGGLPPPAAAQVVLDGTTGPAGALGGPDYAIEAELGTRAGRNLFHSFERFGLRTGESATFSGPGGIANVIGRVTGGERSDIDGTLRSTIAGADLWFLNPAGVMFGPNARLDLQGSFHVSTADELRFADDAVFSAADPGASRLTVAPPEAFGFLGAAPAGIAVDRSILDLPPGEALSLVGGALDVVGGPEGFIRAEAGRVTLAALGGPGEARVGDSAVTAAAAGADIRLTDQALVDASGAGGGMVRIRGGRLVMEGGSLISADNTGPRDGAGGIDLAAGELHLLSGSVLANDVLGSGRGGRTSVVVDRLEVHDGGVIGASTFGAGDAGGVTVTAGRLVISGDGSPSFTGITSQASEGSTGAAGTVAIEAGALELRDGGTIRSDTFAAGDAGAVTVTATELLELRDGGAISSDTSDEGDAGTVMVEAGRLTIAGEGSEFFTGISSDATAGSMGDAGAVTVTANDLLELRDDGVISSDTSGVGRAGRVTVAAERLRVTAGSRISSDTSAAGDAGGVTVRAGRLLVSGAGVEDFTGISSEANPGSAGTAGAVEVTVTGLLELRDGGVIRSDASARGDAGSVTIATDDLVVRRGGVISSSTFAEGNAGTVAVTAAGRLRVARDGSDAFTGITSQAGEGSIGAAGTVAVEAGTLEVRDGGVIGSDTFAVGDAGTVAVTAAGRLLIAGDGSEFFTGIASQANPASAGAAGAVIIGAGELELRDGGQISSGTFTAADAGAVTVTATELLELRDGGAIGSDTSGAGDAGTVMVEAARLRVAAGSRISSDTSAEGDAGTVTVAATERLELRDGGAISSSTFAGGDAGTVAVAAEHLVLRGGGQVAVLTFGAGAAGDLTVNAREVIAVGADAATGSPSGFVASSEGRGSDAGEGGNMVVNVDRLELRGGAQVGSGTFGPGVAGDLTVTAREVIATGANAATGFPSGLFTGTESTAADGGAAGRLVVTADRVILDDGGRISSDTTGGGDAGGVRVTATDLEVHDDDSRISSDTFGDGDAGTVSVTATGLLTLRAGGAISSDTLGAGRAGAVTVTATELTLRAGGVIAAATFAAGDAGTVAVEAGRLRIDGDGSELFTGITSQAGEGSTGRAGSVMVTAPEVFLADGGAVRSLSGGTGAGGSVMIRATDALRLSGGGAVTAETAVADAGDIVIEVGRLVDLADSAITTSAADGTGSGGNISIDPRFVVLDGSRIVAQAEEGAGGDIRIVADHFIRTPDSVVDASSRLGLPGTVAISAPEQDVAGGLVALPASFVDAAALLPASCAARSGPAAGSFSAVGRGGLPQGPEAPLPGFYADLAAPVGGDGAHRADDVLRRAEADLRLGHRRQAIDALQAALPAAEAAGDRRRLAALVGALGAAHLADGAPGLARLALARSLKEAGAAGAAALQAVTLTNVGNALAVAVRAGAAPTVEEVGPAFGAYEGAVELALATGQARLAARAALNAARLLARRGERAGAAERVRLALDQLEEVSADDDPERPLELVAAGLALAAAGAPNGAAAQFERAAALAGARGDGRARSYALGELGALDAAAGRIEDALHLTRRALFLAQAAGAPEALYRWQWQAGRLLAARGEIDAALGAYEGAVATLQAVRADLPAFDPETGRSLFRATVGPVFLELADLLLQRAAEEGDRAAQPRLVQARMVVEGLKGAELADYFKDECLAQLEARAAPLDRLLAEAQAAVLYPVILPDRLELLVSLPDGTLARASAPVPSAELEREAGRLRLALQGLGDARPAARQLYDWLIAPVEREIAGQDIATLVFVPDGPLRAIPLAALHDGTGYLVERYALATAPGLSLLDPRPIARAEIRPLLAGLTESVGGFPPLPQVGAELAAIGALYAGGTMLLNEDFAAAGLREALEAVPYTVVHVASHAQFSSDPEQTFLLTHDGRVGLDELERLLAPSRFREEPVELIALSACETAAGDDRAALGLAGVAVKAGARSALATLWQVSDAATAVAAAEFYRQLGASDRPSKAEALRRAQLMLLADARYREPFYWAPFLLIGNWL